MSFPFNIYLLAGAGGFLASLISLPVWRVICRRVGLVDDPGHRKIHSQPVPLAGGLAVLTGMLAPLVCGVMLLQFHLLPDSYSPSFLVRTGSVDLLSYGFGARSTQLLAIFVGALGMTALGCWDDKHELRASVKFAGQLLIAFLTALAGIRITLFVPNLLFSYAITVLWILTVSNAVNFMDNMNGLCAGLGIISAWSVALLAMGQVHYLVASMGFLFCGALLGFLPYNFPRATAFLGDTGSHLIGYLLSVMAILPHFYSPQHPHPWAVLAPLLLLGVPLLDLVWVVWIRWRLGQPFYIGDNNHLSHRLVRRGLTPTRAVLMIWLMAAILGSIAVWLS